ncbi:MSMEG_0567/Sll0786 family nitrogen starvation N-acetyltransferase [Solimonas marina]|uniref:GNAT family N-acetyltransferase n=1 Tax=Solimonas marina TaxID=2714601 RepID=A0A969WAQ2_9GAMM|nr:MSMEG_0567/Sll0786 family nitrogen starvation N-acetyltransferase [Solimonas marina]NKF23054.1 GNAT family N-acetyltransferase [Solimonas marina]
MLIASTPFVPSEYRVKLITEAWEQREAAALRVAVFCDEQGIFEHDDRDALDRSATTLVAVSCLHGMPEQVVGTVRIHQRRDDATHWQGSRLAVRPEYRRVAWLGSALIRLAVCTAHARGARCFTAHVQAANVPLFERLHWHTLETITLFGRPHHRMQADLAHYPPFAAGDWGFVAGARLAA